MKSDPELEALRGLEWLVMARNRCQTLLLRLLEGWDQFPPDRRQAALAAAFSLWRAVFLLVKEPNQSLDRVDVAAKTFLERVVRRNAISFNDDLTTRSWSSVYYVENAVHSINALTSHEFTAHGTSPVGTVRDAWNEAFKVLDECINGGLIVPHDVGEP